MAGKSRQEAQIIAEKIGLECLSFRVRLLSRVVSRIYDQALRAYDIRASQFGLLSAIELFGPVQPGEIGERLGLEKSTVSRNVRVMIGRNWVRVRDSEDGRAQLLELTPGGRKLFVRASSAWEAAQKETMALLGPDNGAVIDHLFKGAQGLQKPFASIEEFARDAFPARSV